MQRLVAFEIAAALSWTGASLAGPSGPTAAFKAWSAACDNTRSCTAIGFTENAAEPGPHLFITRGAGAGDAPKVEIGLGYNDGVDALKAGDRVEIAIDGPAPLRFTADIRRGPESYDWPEVVFPAGRTDAFLAALLQGRRMTVSHAGQILGATSLEGASASLRWVDDQQKRAGTVTALVARGPRPASSVPAAPEQPVVRLAPAVSQSDLPSPPAALLGRADVRECASNYEEEEMRGPRASRLSATEYLWHVPCGAGAYNFNALFIIARADGSGARSPGFDAMPQEPDHLINASYDPKTRILESFAKGRGVGDCGLEARWAWDGRAFQLIHMRRMDECLGVTSEHWPVLWRARTRN